MNSTKNKLNSNKNKQNSSKNKLNSKKTAFFSWYQMQPASIIFSLTSKVYYSRNKGHKFKYIVLIPKSNSCLDMIIKMPSVQIIYIR